mmetsp:Transcript_14973/g.17304  ORF Transcript_14973/g.17304 Transcript_14973/m.17304 type:complete len:85 (+) Transcript_14973:3-257(+)
MASLVSFRISKTLKKAKKSTFSKRRMSDSQVEHANSQKRSKAQDQLISELIEERKAKVAQNTRNQRKEVKFIRGFPNSANNEEK